MFSLTLISRNVYCLIFFFTDFLIFFFSLFYVSFHVSFTILDRRGKGEWGRGWMEVGGGGRGTVSEVDWGIEGRLREAGLRLDWALPHFHDVSCWWLMMVSWWWGPAGQAISFITIITIYLVRNACLFQLLTPALIIIYCEMSFSAAGFIFRCFIACCSVSAAFHRTVSFSFSGKYIEEEGEKNSHWDGGVCRQKAVQNEKAKFFKKWMSQKEKEKVSFCFCLYRDR